MNGTALLSPLKIPHYPSNNERRDRDGDHGDHALLEARGISCGIEYEGPPGIDDIIPHAVSIIDGQLASIDTDNVL